MLSPEAIQSKEFEQSVLGGYRRDEVDTFLDELEADYRKLFDENTEMLKRLTEYTAKIEEYRKDEEFLKTAIINVQRLNETTLREIETREKEVETSSKEKAAQIVAAAEQQAAEIVKKAEIESADAVRAAREQCRAEIDVEQKKSAAEIALIHKETEAEQKKLDYLRQQVAEFKNTIVEIYKAHLTSISKLPDFTAEQPAKKEEPVVKEEAPAPESAPVEREVLEQPEEPAPAAPVEDNTVEFKISEKKEKREQSQVTVIKPNRFENLKFGVDYDINKDE